MKNKILLGVMTLGLLGSTTSVYAMGNATVSFDSNNTVKVGDTFTVKMNVEDITDTYDGVVSMGGNLSFDNTKIEYISSKGIETPYQFQINEDYNYKIAGLDFTLDNGIKNNLTVYEFTFKALEEGNTTITLTNAKLTDSKEYINTNVVSKEINIINKKEEKQTPANIKPVVKTELENTKVENKIETETKVEVETNKTETKEEIVVALLDNKINTNTKKEENVIEKVINNITNFFSKILNLFK
ncbi:MAG: cohesin domain-containing protein [Tenericutes bacterium]|nr:cohesin domain-containing protein [Mycoplasmatota bacterium]